MDGPGRPLVVWDSGKLENFRTNFTPFLILSMVPSGMERRRGKGRTQPKECKFMAELSMKQLLEAGVHFGHQPSRWNPKMKPYIFGARNGIHIIDLQQTVAMIKDLEVVVRDLAASGGQVLFVGTKKQAQDAVREEAVRCGMFHVHNRWLGGTLTNFSTLRLSVGRWGKLE